MSAHAISIIYGDGIGPEVVTSARNIIEAVGVSIAWEECEAGAKVFQKGLATGLPQETIDSIKRNRVALKGPLETPIGVGEKSANVTLRKLFETYANVRPVKECPGVITPFSGRGIDLVIVRENVEDLYAGIEYKQTPHAAECLKLITSKGCEKIIRFAFELARAEGRKSLHCATKANIMKLTEGLMKQLFEAASHDYPDIEAQHIIVDNCAHQLVRFPDKFEMIVTTNMNGDILSDLGSGLVGGLGFAPGANFGEDVAIFEAVHGSAPKYKGRNVINPTALILSSVMMLRHIGEFAAAHAIEQALYVTLGTDRISTRDVAGDERGVTTTAFTTAVMKNLGKTFDALKMRNYKPIGIPIMREEQAPHKRSVRGIDVYIETHDIPKQVGKTLEAAIKGQPFALKTIASRGVQAYPSSGARPDLGDHLCCRFLWTGEDSPPHNAIVALLTSIDSRYPWMHIEKLNVYNDQPGFSKLQGEE